MRTFQNVLLCISKERSTLEERRPRTGQADSALVRTGRKRARSSRPTRAEPEQLPGPPPGESVSTRSGRRRECRRSSRDVSEQTCWIGIDISKAELDVAVRPSGVRWQAHHDAAGIDALVERCVALAPQRIVVEATGGFEIGVAAALAPLSSSASPRQQIRRDAGSSRGPRVSTAPHGVKSAVSADEVP